MTQKYRDALQKYLEFCSFFENGGSDSVQILMCKSHMYRYMLHLKRETVSSAYFPVMGVYDNKVLGTLRCII